LLSASAKNAASFLITTIRVDLFFKIIPDGITSLNDEEMMLVETCEEHGHKQTYTSA
jgi:hypothetical protein